MIELIPLSSAKADHYAKLRARLAVQKASEHEAIAAIDELCHDNERLALRSQASVAAALEAAAGKCDAFAAFRQKQLDDDESKHWQDQDAILKRAWKMSISGLEAAASEIRALITPAQHDALAAHGAAAVANARAEDAAKIDGSAGVRIQDVAQYLIDHMPAYNSEHPCWEALQDANDDGADEDDCIRAWLRSIAQIGAKP